MIVILGTITLIGLIIVVYTFISVKKQNKIKIQDNPIVEEKLSQEHRFYQELNESLNTFKRKYLKLLEKKQSTNEIMEAMQSEINFLSLQLGKKENKKPLSIKNKCEKTEYQIAKVRTTKKENKPLIIDTPQYKGAERRDSIRIPVKISVRFSFKGILKISETKNISPTGLLIESEYTLPVGAFMVFHISLPQEFYSIPIAVVGQVMRSTPIKTGNFDIGLRIIKIPKDDLKLILEYARSQ